MSVSRNGGYDQHGQRSALMQCVTVNADTLLFEAGNKQLSACSDLEGSSVPVPFTRLRVCHDKQVDKGWGGGAVKCFPLDVV